MKLNFEIERSKAHIWYWLQLAIWPLIRDTDCVYCIFLRGVILGGFLMGVAWMLLK